MFGLSFGGGRAKVTEEAERLCTEGNATLLDVRTRDEFACGHVRGAANIPVDQLSARLAEVPKGRTVVVYCRSGGRSAAAAQVLQAAGHRVLDVGPMPAW